MKVKNELFEILARTQSLNRLSSVSDLDSEMKFHIFDLKNKVIEAEKPYLECRKELLGKFSDNGEVLVEKKELADAEFKKILDIEVELDHKVLVIPKLPKEISPNDMFNLRDLVNFQNKKKSKKKK